ncbi:MAG: C10 family peptidase [Paludibacteraceae bacterium]|nr:C10 family peptidase [Paludibacteraceae bacterium]
MKKLLLYIGLCWAVTDMFAAPITPDEASQIAIQWLGKKSGVARRVLCGDSRITEAESTANQPIYVYNFGQDGGWVLIAGDDRARSMVLGYSESGYFDYERLCDAEKAWIDGYAEQINTLQYAPDDWDNTENDCLVSRKAVQTVVAPMLTTAWKQGSPYNTDCPVLRDTITKVGCVALAWAMVCKYMEYPATSSFSYDYIWAKNDSVRRYGQVSSTYDYSLMPNQLTTQSTQQTQDAVARLCADIGDAIQMNYGTTSSSVTPRFALGKMVEKFGLDQGMINHYRNYYSDADWDAMLMRELDSGRPVIYSGWKATGGGHTFICDGYNSNGYFHFNYGQGSVNATTYYKSSAVKSNYNNNQEAITHIVASRSSQLPGVDATYNGNLSFNASEMQFTVDAKVHFSVTQPCKIYHAICCENIGTEKKYYGKEKDITCKTSNDWSYTITSMTYDLPLLTRMSMPNGIYRCYPVYRVTVDNVSGEYERFYFPTEEYTSELCIQKSGTQYTLVDCPQPKPTDMQLIRPEDAACSKFIRNRHLVLRYDGVEYDALGNPIIR